MVWVEGFNNRVEAPYASGDSKREEAMKVREAIEYVERDGWFQVATVGDHRQYKHPQKKGRVTIPGKLSDDLLPKTARSVFKQAQIPWPKGRR